MLVVCSLCTRDKSCRSECPRHSSEPCPHRIRSYHPGRHPASHWRGWTAPGHALRHHQHKHTTHNSNPNAPELHLQHTRDAQSRKTQQQGSGSAPRMTYIAHRDGARDLLVGLQHDVHEDLVEHVREYLCALQGGTRPRTGLFSTTRGDQRAGALTKSLSASSRSFLGAMAPLCRCGSGVPNCCCRVVCSCSESRRRPDAVLYDLNKLDLLPVP